MEADDGGGLDVLEALAENGGVPAAVLATPGAQDLANAKGGPTHEPEPGGEEREDQVEGMIEPGLYKGLLMPAPGAVRAYFVFFHPEGQ